MQQLPLIFEIAQTSQEEELHRIHQLTKNEVVDHGLTALATAVILPFKPRKLLEPRQNSKESIESLVETVKLFM